MVVVALASMRAAHRLRSNRRPRSRPAPGRGFRRRAPRRDQRELRAQISGARPVRLVLGYISVRKVFSTVEDDSQMRWFVVCRHFGQDFHSMLQKPSTALTCSPSDLRVSGAARDRRGKCSRSRRPERGGPLLERRAPDSTGHGLFGAALAVLALDFADAGMAECGLSRRLNQCVLTRCGRGLSGCLRIVTLVAVSRLGTGSVMQSP